MPTPDPVIINPLGGVVADRFALAQTPDAVGGPALVPLAAFLAAPDAWLARSAETGVAVASDERVEDLAPYLDRLALIAAVFPKFMDGRGFSTGRLARVRYGFAGPIRAAGHVIADQVVHLVRAGFDEITLAHAHLAPARRALATQGPRPSYQPAVGVSPVWEARRPLPMAAE